MTQIEIDLTKLERGTHVGRVKVTRGGKTFYRRQRVGVKEGEKEVKTSKKYYPAMDKYLDSLGDNAVEIEKTIKDYTKADYVNVNNYMRTGEIPDGVSREGIEKTINDISKFLESAPKVEKGTEIYRGINFRSKEKLEEYMSNIKGKQFVTMKAFTSCTKDEMVLADFARSSGNSVILKIEPSTGVYLDGLSDQPEEDEVLISGDSIYEIKDVKDEHGLINITLKQWK